MKATRHAGRWRVLLWQHKLTVTGIDIAWYIGGWDLAFSKWIGRSDSIVAIVGLLMTNRGIRHCSVNIWSFLPGHNLTLCFSKQYWDLRSVYAEPTDYMSHFRYSIRLRFWFSCQAKYVCGYTVNQFLAHGRGEGFPLPPRWDLAVLSWSMAAKKSPASISYLKKI